METWKEIPGFDSMYEVSDLGRVRSFRNGRWGEKDEALILNPILKKGFHVVKLRRPDVKHQNTYLIHRLVAEVFVPNPNNYRYVKHKDGNTTNNRADNLIWYKFKIVNWKGDTVTIEEKRMKLLVKCSSMPCTVKCPLYNAGIKCGEGTGFMKRDGDKYDMPDKTIELAYKMMFEGYKPKTVKAMIAKVQEKQLVGVHNCPYASGLQCDWPDSRCASCGWNPDEAADRKERLEALSCMKRAKDQVLKLRLRRRVR